jgi:lysophospholipase L1-like esterase
MIGRSSRRPWAVGSAAIVVAIAVVVAGLHIARGSSPVDQPPDTVTGRPRVAVTLPPVPRGSKVVIYGDSYTAAVNASSPRQGYARRASTHFGWKSTIIGAPGSGFTKPGVMRVGTYGERLQTLITGADGAQLIVIQGGLNDVDPVATRAAASAFFGRLRAAEPHTPIVFFGPVDFKGHPTVSQQAIDRTLTAVTASLRVPYLSPIAENWITTADVRRYFPAHSVHPNDRGYAYLASRLESDLRGLGV